MTGRTPRLAIVVSSNRRRGAEVQAERMCEELTRLGWEVSLYALAGERPPTISARPLAPHGTIGRFDPGLIRRLRSELRSLQPDVVVAWGGASLRYVAAASVRLGIPLRCYVAVGIPSAWLRSAAHARWYRLLAGRFDAIAAVSQATANDLEKSVGVPQEKVAVIPSGVPATFLDIEPPVPRGPLRAVFIGSLTPEKDPVAAIAIVEAAARVIALELRIVGAGPLAEEVGTRARTSTVSIVPIGAVDDVRPHLAWSDLLLITSRTEALPGAALEAMAASRPVISFDIGALGEIVRAGLSGILVPPGDREAAASALIELGGDRARLAALGTGARAVVAAGHLQTQAAERFDRFLRDHLARVVTMTTERSPR